MTDVKDGKLSDITPDANNANLGTQRGLEMLESSLRKHGAGRSILLDRKGRIIAGNKTVEQAGQIGLDELIIVKTDGTQLVAVQREDLDLADDSTGARELAYDDNRVGELDLSWNPETILADLESGVDLSGLFRKDELSEILGELGKEPQEDPGAQVDKAAELQAKWGTATGQIWELGEHRLACGDCTDKAVVESVMRGGKANCVCTDPPYAFGLASTSQMATKSGGWHDIMNNASWFTDRFRQWAEIVKDGPVWVFCNWRTLPILMRSGFDSKKGIDSVMVWYKDWIGPGGMKGLRPTYELITLTVLGNYAIPNRGTEDFINIPWSSHKPTGHKAEKPIDLIKSLVEISAVDLIYDPFLGSGTALIACEQLGRKCRCIEIDPGYCAVTLERWHTMTGKDPVLTNA